MFFWLYAIIELLAIFLDSGIIPTANSSYPVSGLQHSKHDPSLMMSHNSGSLLSIQDLSLPHTPVLSSTVL